VSAGECRLVLEEGGGTHRLGPGDFVVVPRGDAHRLQAGAAAHVERVEVVAARVRDGRAQAGPGEAVAEYLCGAFRFGALDDHPLLSALPPAIVVRSAGGAPHPWLTAHLDAVACESRSGRPGGEAVVTRLSEVLFVQAIRYHLAELPAGATGWLAALRDASLGRAVALMHRHPERAWTVATLAREVGMSRSHFAERFAAVVGRAPLAYLADWRMHVGRTLLRDGGLRVGEVARRVGYGSEAAFSTAFKRATGVAPGAYRKAG
jgi:AraC-like DNA-binding protein